MEFFEAYKIHFLIKEGLNRQLWRAQSWLLAIAKIELFISEMSKVGFDLCDRIKKKPMAFKLSPSDVQLSERCKFYLRARF